MTLPVIESASRFVVAIILNSIWEDGLLVFAVWLLLRSLPNTNASTRYFSWLVTMIAAVVLPVATTIPQTTFLPEVHKPVVATHAGVLSPFASRTIFGAQSKNPQPALQATNAAQPATFHTPERLRLFLPSWLATVLFALWLLSAVVIAVRLAVDLILLERLKRDSLPLPIEFRDQMERWVKAAYGNAREVRICVSERIEVPVAVGLFDSMILLPQHLLSELSAGELDRISLHELAHLHRGDDWTNSVQRFAQTLLFFNPAVRFVGAQLDLEREVACDDWVLSLTGEVRPYATCLTRMAELTSWPHRPLAAPGVFVTRKGISIRIERLLNKHRNAHVKVAYGVPVSVAIALVGFFVLANVVTPVIAYTTESASSTVASVSRSIAIVTHPHHKQAAPPAIAPVPVVPVIAKAVPAISPPQKVRKPLAAPKSSKIHPPVPRTPHIFGQLAPIAQISPWPHWPRMPRTPHATRYGPGNVDIPEVNVDVPAQNFNVHVPAIHVHVPGQHIEIPQVADQYNDFSGQNLAGHNFRGQRLSGSDFARANLQNADFSGSTIVGTDFSRSNLRGANFSNTRLSGCDFSHADLTGAIFDGAQITGCDWNARSLSPGQARALLSGCREGCDFAGADLRNQDLRHLRLNAIDLSGADLRGSDLSGSRFNAVDFSHAKMSGARVDGASFMNCDFDGADLSGVNMSAAQTSN
jgi:uncharacterized protein YjbI with pentapeptide repeats/beta-lactamase regulating signal transducer with metallopeptidase domain